MRYASIFSEGYGIWMQLLKHHKHDYKIPNVDGFETKMSRKFTKGKLSTCHNAEFFELRIKEEEAFKKNENLFWKMVEDSYDMMKNKNDAILRINYWKNTISSTLLNIEDDRLKLEEFCEKVLNPDYRYDLK